VVDDLDDDVAMKMVLFIVFCSDDISLHPQTKTRGCAIRNAAFDVPVYSETASRVVTN